MRESDREGGWTPYEKKLARQSEAINELAAALAKAQASLEHAKKDSENPHFRSRFASLASIWDAWREAGPANGLAITQTLDVGDSGGVFITTTLLHESGQWMRSTYPVRPTKDDPQGYGSAITYARRYSLSALVGLSADEDDDGNQASEHDQREHRREQGTDPGEERMAAMKVKDFLKSHGVKAKFVSRNKYAGECHEAGLPVEAGAGWYVILEDDEKRTYSRDGLKALKEDAAHV